MTAGLASISTLLSGRRGLDLLRGEPPAGAGLVFHNDRDAELGLQLVAHDAGHAVAGAARGVADDDAQRPLDRLGVQGQGGGSGEAARAVPIRIKRRFIGGS
jgi:hypothetical protein